MIEFIMDWIYGKLLVRRYRLMNPDLMARRARIKNLAKKVVHKDK